MDKQEKNLHPYEALTPDLLLNAIESVGYPCSGSMLALNSYENRVYQVGLDDGSMLVAKFYRPERWTDACIQEEHDFTLELAENEIPVVAPLVDERGATLHTYEGFRFALYPRRGGRWPILDVAENREQMGRFMGRIHALGASGAFRHRPVLSVDRLGRESFDYLMEHGFIPGYLELSYRTLVEDLLAQVSELFQRAGKVAMIRLHGDCHPGNVLWTDAGPHFVDFDDACTGPAIQDLWMLLSGERSEMTMQLADLLEGYTQFFDFNPKQLLLVEALRTLRMLHYSAWLARRWDDPAFPRSFPWFNEQRYWEEQVLGLREQAALMNEPALVWD